MHRKRIEVTRITITLLYIVEVFILIRPYYDENTVFTGFEKNRGERYILC